MARQGGRPTIIDVARRAGVSFKTVSRVLNGNSRVDPDMRRRVIEAAAELDYRANVAARSLAGPRTYSLALLIALHLEDMRSNDDWYFPAFYSDLQFAALLACQAQGYRMTVEICDVSPNAPPFALPVAITSQHVDGVIVVPPLCDQADVVTALQAAGIPHVLIAPGLNIEDGLSVATDEYGGAAAMTRHLLDLGHRAIAFVNGPEGHNAAAARQRAFRDVLAEADPALVPLIAQGAFTFASGFHAAETLLRGATPPTAIFCANDDMAAGAIAAATRMGIRVPDQLSIAGFDDSVVARVTSPPLTTVRQSFGAMADEAVRLLATATAETESQHVILPARLIERGSTAGPPA